MSDDTYTHRPGEVDRERGGRADDGPESGAAERTNEDSGGPGESGDPAEPADPAAPIERGREEWTRRDWLLVGVVVLCFLVVPATILILPPVRPFRFAYLVLPMIPAFLLGAVAVWSAQRST